MTINNLNKTIHKIENSKLELKPFPHIIIKDFIPKELFLKFTASLPNYHDLKGENIFTQSKSGTKKSIFYESNFFKKINSKNKYFKEVILIFKKIEKSVNKKFNKEFNKHIRKKYISSKTTFSCSLSSCIKRYKKSAHLDRREHKITFLYYPQIQKNYGGNLCLWSTKKKEIYDVFPPRKNINISKKILPSPNSCVISLNTPDSYHSVTEFLGDKERKYFYAVYDFPTYDDNYKLKERKKGNNQNIFWKLPVKVFSKKRMLNFINE